MAKKTKKGTAKKEKVSKVEETEKKVVKDEVKTEEKKEETKKAEPVKKEEPKKEEKPKEKKYSTAIDNKCPNCGAALKFDPDINKFNCRYCDGQFTLEELSKKYKTAATEEQNKHEHLEEDEGDLFQYNCPDCGAIIVADEQTSATFCVYCGNTAILKNKLAGKFHPRFIIPFKHSAAKAKAAFKNISKGRIFVPSDFNNEDNIEKIRGIYIPFWLYDINFTGSINATSTSITTWRVGRTHYTKTDIYDNYRNGTMEFLKVPVDGSTRFANDLMNSIEPFDYTELVEYNHAYLSGFLAEKYDIEDKDCYNDAKKRITSSAERELLSTVSRGASVRIKKRDYKDENFNTYYVLLPVYMVNVKYRGEYYTFAMNGQTGKFVGNIPLDKGKVVKTSIYVFLICIVAMELAFLAFHILGGI